MRLIFGLYRKSNQVEVTKFEIRVIQLLKNKKAPGYDLIRGQILK